MKVDYEYEIEREMCVMLNVLASARNQVPYIISKPWNSYASFFSELSSESLYTMHHTLYIIHYTLD